MSKFTKGKWSFYPPTRNVIADLSKVIAKVQGAGMELEEADTNARLIANAPEMYNLLAYLLKRVRGEYMIELFVNSKSMVQAEELLSRIDGEQEAQS